MGKNSYPDQTAQRSTHVLSDSKSEAEDRAVKVPQDSRSDARRRILALLKLYLAALGFIGLWPNAGKPATYRHHPGLLCPAGLAGAHSSLVADGSCRPDGGPALGAPSSSRSTAQEPRTAGVT